MEWGFARRSFGCGVFVFRSRSGPVEARARVRELPAGATILVMPIDIELFELSVGGVPAPRADWTQEAGERIRQTYLARKEGRMQMADMQDDPQVVELNRLHEAVAASILVHHFNPNQGLRAKYGRLDWSLGSDATRLGRRRAQTTLCLPSCAMPTRAAPGRRSRYSTPQR